MTQADHHAMKDLTFAVIGAAMEVHRELGPGYLESVYEEALSIELTREKIKHQRQVPIPLRYKGHALEKSHRLDFLVEDRLILELKAVAGFEPIHRATTLSYLKATRCPLGLLINFNTTDLKDGILRVIATQP